jgi:hypothetical protein
MKRSELTTLAEDVFGRSLARTYLTELRLGDLGNRSCREAIEDGEDVRTAWTALCDEMQVPESRRGDVEPSRRRG